jgi:hypothetical protein
MAARRRDAQGQLAAASHLRANFCSAHHPSLLDAFAPPREESLAGDRLCRSDVVRADGDHAHWTSRWNTQRCRNTVSNQATKLLQIFVEPSDRLIKSIGLVLRFDEEVAFAGINDELRRYAQRL